MWTFWPKGRARSEVGLFLLIGPVIVMLITVQGVRNAVSPVEILSGFAPGLALDFALNRVKVLCGGRPRSGRG